MRSHVDVFKIVVSLVKVNDLSDIRASSLAEFSLRISSSLLCLSMSILLEVKK